MCLFYSSTLTKEQKQRIEPFVAYKLYYRMRKAAPKIAELASPFRHETYNGIIKEPGTFESSPIGFRLSDSSRDKQFNLEGIEKCEGNALDISGFHSFLKREGAEALMKLHFLQTKSHAIVEVTIDPKDIVAAGRTLSENELTETVVSSKITISPEEFNKSCAYTTTIA